MNRINIICLGVKDMEKAIRFYRDGLGFQTKEKSNTPDVIFFSTSGTKEVFWGGYHAYFADLDGYCWEVAWGPRDEFDDNDMLVL